MPLKRLGLRYFDACFRRRRVQGDLNESSAP